MTKTNRIARRPFLSGLIGGLMLGTSTAPRSPTVLLGVHVLASQSSGRSTPGATERIGLGFIGVGRRGQQLMSSVPPMGRIVAVADVDLRRAQEAAQRASCDWYTDYRHLLDRQDVDAVVIATPDHWHVIPAIHACLARKDIYLEKPLSLTIREGRLLVDAVRKHARVLQTGTQRRSMRFHRLGCELVRNGVAGKIHTVLIENYPSPWECGLPGQPVPEGLDWNAWCGPTEVVPYHEDIFIQRANPGWISFRPWSGGEMTGTGAHGFDQIQWSLECDHTGPVEIWSEGGKLQAPVYYEPEGRQRGDRLCSEGHRVRMRYANGIVIRLEPGESAAGATFIGDLGKIRVGNNELSANPEDLIRVKPDELKFRLPEINNHMENWLDCIKTRERPIADVEIGHRTATICHLGNIVRWIGRPLRWDPEKELFPEDKEANQYLDRPRRKPYTLPETV